MGLFKDIKTWVEPDGRVSICWDLEPSTFILPFSVFKIEFARPGGPWEEIGDISEGCCYLDPYKRDFGVISDSAYRVVLEQPGRDPEYSSAVSAARGFDNRRDWLHAREIIRQAYLDLKKGGGRKGLLSIRKRWGVACPECLDFVTKKPTVSTCSICLGTGFTGGYHPPIQYWIKTGDKKDVTRRPTEFGMSAPVVEQGWGVSWPQVSELDIWVDQRSSYRHEVISVISNTEFIGIPLTWMLSLGRLAKGQPEPTMSDIMTEALVDYPSPADNGGWRPGFDFDGSF